VKSEGGSKIFEEAEIRHRAQGRSGVLLQFYKLEQTVVSAGLRSQFNHSGYGHKLLQCTK